MGNASSSVARLSNAASADPLAGMEPANDAYGSLASLASRPKPKKKPVLVLDAEELAAAHELFQQGAAEQLEDAEQVERVPVTLGLAPLGSEMSADDLLDDDEEEYVEEADAPAPDAVLGLTRSDGSDADKPRKNPNKSMVALPPDGSDELGAVEPFVPLAPVDSDDLLDDDHLGDDHLGDGHLGDDHLGDEPSGEEIEESEEIQASFEDMPLPFTKDETADSAPEPPISTFLADEPAPEDSGPVAEHVDNVVPAMDPAPAEATDGPRITRVEEEEIDGSAFMRAPERHKIDLANAATPTETNSLRARLVRGEEPVFEEEDRSLWARFTGWLRDVWSRFLG